MSTVSDLHDRAIAAVTDWLASDYPEAKRADPWQLRQHDLGSGWVGWRVSLEKGVSLLVAVDRFFPYSKPITALFGPDVPTNAPHVERNQKLCTFGTAATTDHGDPVGVVKQYIDSSIRLFADIKSGRLREDFQVDFPAYWERSATASGSVQIIGDLKPPTRIAFSATYNGKLVVSDDMAALSGWISNLLNRPFSGDISPAYLIWADPLPYPEEYPSSLDDLRFFLSKNASEINFGDLTQIKSKGVVFVIAGPSGDGASAGAIILTEASSRSRGGFRPTSPPRAFVPIVQRVRAQLVDASKSRVPMPQLQATHNLRIAVIGCGSLGAGTAKLLAQQGVRDLLLFDGDVLGWENIGRHELGASHVGQNKAEALAASLRQNLPSLGAVIAYDVDWREAFIRDEQVFSAVDVIVSATANWEADAFLSDLQVSRDINLPVVFGWMERNALAAHAVALSGGNPCLRCGFDPTGTPALMATAWWSENNDPRCAGPTSPYGAIDLSMAQGLLASLAIDVGSHAADTPVWRIWTGRTHILENLGGFWSGRFLAEVGDPGHGGKLLAGQWIKDKNCDCG